jgi:hypothetical protein
MAWGDQLIMNGLRGWRQKMLDGAPDSGERAKNRDATDRAIAKRSVSYRCCSSTRGVARRLHTCARRGVTFRVAEELGGGGGLVRERDNGNRFNLRMFHSALERELFLMTFFCSLYPVVFHCAKSSTASTTFLEPKFGRVLLLPPLASPSHLVFFCLRLFVFLWIMSRCGSRTSSTCVG